MAYSDTEHWQAEPPEEIYQQAHFLENLQYTRVAQGLGVQTALASGFPVCFGIFLPSAAYEIAGANGEMSLGGKTLPAGEAGGHAMLIVGYDLLQHHYIVRNSWGEDYGDGGYLYIPFDVMESCSHKESFWVVGQLEQFGVLSATDVSQGQSDRVTQARGFLRTELEGQVADARKGLRDRLTKK